MKQSGSLVINDTSSEIFKPDLARDIRSAQDFIKKSLSPNTIKAYRSQWDQFSAWCVSCGLPFLPAAPETVSVFISFLARKQKNKLSTIERMLSSISKAHKASKHDSPIRSEIVHETYSGIRREIGSDQSRADPLGVSALKSIVDSFDNSERGLRDRALLLVGFMGGFRRSELVSVLRSDVKFVEDGVRINLRRSKTDQEGKGFIKAIPKAIDKTYCPVAALRDWFAMSESKFMLSHVDGARGPAKLGQKLSDKMIDRLIKKWTAFLELDGYYSGHSLRTGFVTAAALAGKNNRSIMKITGHKSYKMVDRYVRVANEFEDNAAVGLL